MIYVLSGGQTGATLTVTSSGAGTITVSNASLGKSYSKSVTAGSSAVFKGLATGTWTVKLSNGTQTSTKTIKITSDYSISIAYFSATISITYPANSNCVVTNSGGQTVASDTNTGSSTKTWTATVNATGTYTVTATSTDGSGKSKSQSVSITQEGQFESVTISYAVYFLRNGELNAILGNIVLKSGTTTFSNGVISGTYPQDSISSFSFANPITVSLNTLKFRALQTNWYESSSTLQVGLCKTNNLPNGYYDGSYVFEAVKRVNALQTDYEEFSLDVSALSGQSLYIVGNAIATWKIDAIWAE